MCPQNFLVIGGGVGPAAGVAFHQKIIDRTNNEILGDQGHAPVIHLSMSPFILDRTRFLQKKIDNNPGINMGLAVRKACETYAQAAHRFIVGVPCNTFHSKSVFDAYKSIAETASITLVNMISETAMAIRADHEGKKIILISTRGTRNTAVYDDYFRQMQFVKCDGDERVVLEKEHDFDQAYFFSDGLIPNMERIAADQQGAIMAAIYDKPKGLKYGTKRRKHARVLFETVVQQLQGDTEKNECCVIMGCTEIPLAYIKDTAEQIAARTAGDYVDPMDILASKMLLSAGYPLKLEHLDPVVIAAGAPDGELGAAEIRARNKQVAEEFTRSLSPLRSKL